MDVATLELPERVVKVIPHKCVREIEKLLGGSLDFCSFNHSLTLCFRDNRYVTTISNYMSIQPMITFRSYDKNEKEKKHISCLAVTKDHNTNMSGIN